MLILAMILCFGLCGLLFRRRAVTEGNATVIEPANRAVEATVDGKPVRSYIADD